MKPSSFFPRIFRAACFLLTLVAVAQEPPPAVEKPAPAPEPPAANEAPAAVEPTEPKRGLRRINPPDTSETAPPSENRRYRERHSPSDNVPFGDHLVPKGNSIQHAVSIFGANVIEGEVRNDAVSVLGRTTIGPDARVGGAAVAVLGPLESEGEIRGEAVSVLGGIDINGHVHREVVSVLGDLHLGPKAVIDGNVVLVGGKFTKDPGAIINGNEVNVPMLGGHADVEWIATWVRRCLFLGRPLAFGAHLAWAWAVAFSFLAFYLVLALLFGRGIERCLETLETRPGSSILAAVLTVLLSPLVILLLIVTIVGALLVPFIGAGLFFASLFGKAVMLAWIGRRCTKLAGDRRLNHPAIAVLIGGAIVMLLYTIWGSFVLYKLMTWLGLGVVVYTIALTMKRETPAVAAAAPGRASPPPPFRANPAPANFAVNPPPVTSAPAPKMSAGFSAPNNPMTDTAPVPTPPTVPTPSSLTETLPPTPIEPPTTGFTPPAAASIPPLADVPLPPPPPIAPRPEFVLSAATLPRAGFFIRLAAMLIDAVLIGFTLGFTSGMVPHILRFSWFPSGLLLTLVIYAAIMWRHKGTTIGGVICGLKVVRLDDREIDWTTAIVRALSCFLSLFAAGLGFIWVAIDPDRQSWHDKIAGTTVICVPKGVSLL